MYERTSLKMLSVNVYKRSKEISGTSQANNSQTKLVCLTCNTAVSLSQRCSLLYAQEVNGIERSDVYR